MFHRKKKPCTFSATALQFSQDNQKMCQIPKNIRHRNSKTSIKSFYISYISPSQVVHISKFHLWQISLFHCRSMFFLQHLFDIRKSMSVYYTTNKTNTEIQVTVAGEYTLTQAELTKTRQQKTTTESIVTCNSYKTQPQEK